jgi:hypothetical protein
VDYSKKVLAVMLARNPDIAHCIQELELMQGAAFSPSGINQEVINARLRFYLPNGAGRMRQKVVDQVEKILVKRLTQVILSPPHRAEQILNGVPLTLEQRVLDLLLVHPDGLRPSEIRNLLQLPAVSKAHFRPLAHLRQLRVIEKDGWNRYKVIEVQEVDCATSA